VLSRRAKEALALFTMLGVLVCFLVFSSYWARQFELPSGGGSGELRLRSQADDEVELEFEELEFPGPPTSCTDSAWSYGPSWADRIYELDVTVLDDVAYYIEQGYALEWVRVTKLAFHVRQWGDAGLLGHSDQYFWWAVDLPPGNQIDYHEGKEDVDTDLQYSLSVELDGPVISLKAFVKCEAYAGSGDAHIELSHFRIWGIIHMTSGEGASMATLRVFVSYYFYHMGYYDAAEGAIVRVCNASGLVAEKVAERYDDERALAEFKVSYGDYVVEADSDLGATYGQVTVDEECEEVWLIIYCGESWITPLNLAMGAGIGAILVLAVAMALTLRARRGRR